MDIQGVAQLLGNFGEFFGAIAVVVTLVYLGTQVRTANRIATAEASRTRNSDLNGLNATFAQIPEFRKAMAVAFRKGAPRSEVDPEEALVLDMYVLSITNIYEQVYREVREGILDDVMLTEFEARSLFDTPFYRTSWRIYRNALSPSFVEFFERRFGLE